MCILMPHSPGQRQEKYTLHLRRNVDCISEVISEA